MRPTSFIKELIGDRERCGDVYCQPEDVEFVSKILSQWCGSLNKSPRDFTIQDETSCDKGMAYLCQFGEVYSISTEDKTTLSLEIDLTHAHIILESLRQEIAIMNRLPAVESEFMRGYIESAKQAIDLIERAAKAKMEQ